MFHIVSCQSTEPRWDVKEVIECPTDRKEQDKCTPCCKTGRGEKRGCALEGGFRRGGDGNLYYLVYDFG
jgi:hypothetical protein